MSVTDCFSVRVCQLFGLVAVLCAGSCVGLGQRLHLDDRDVSLSEIRKEDTGAAESATVRSSNQIGRQRRLLISGDHRTPDRILLEQAIYAESSRYKIDPNLVFAIVWQESRFRLGAISPKNARGAMQLMPETAVRFGVRDPHDPKESVRGGVAYLVWLLDRFGGNVALALAGYNSGEASVEAYLFGKTLILKDGKVVNRRGIRNDGIPPYAETVDYVRRVAERYRLLRMASMREVIQ